MPNDFDTSGYPLGSTHPYVLYNNAGNEDLFVNDIVNETWVDRPPFNRVRKTIYGMEQEFLRALEKMGYETTYLTYVDGQPLQVDRPTQLISYGGSLYAVKLPATFPITLSGNWATDAPLLNNAGDGSLRSELLSGSGPSKRAGMVGFERSTLPTTINTVGEYLSGLEISVWEYANLVTDKPSAGDPNTWNWTPAIQGALNAAAALPNGGTVLLPPGDYRISTGASIRWGLSMPSNVSLIGMGRCSKIFVDPAIVTGATIFHAIMIGTDVLPSSHCRVANFRLVGNQVAIGGAYGTVQTKYVQGIASRLDSGGSQLLWCDDIVVDGCWIEDVNIAVSCAKDTTVDHNLPARIAAQHRHWVVRNTVIDGTTNKAIEFAECRNSEARGNTILNAVAGPQSIQASRNIGIISNLIEYRETGINITHNSRGTVVIGNRVVAIDAANALSALIIRSEPHSDASFIGYFTISGNEFIDEISASTTVFCFQTRTQNTSMQVIGGTISSNMFNGTVRFHDINLLLKLECRDLVVSGNFIQTFVTVTVAQDNIQQIAFTGNYVFLACSFNGTNWRIQNSSFKQTLTLTASSNNNYLNGNYAGSTFVNSGTGNTGLRENRFNSNSPLTLYGQLTNSTNPTRVTFSTPFKTGTIPGLSFSLQGTTTSDATYANLDATGFDLYTFSAGSAAVRTLSWVAVGVQ